MNCGDIGKPGIIEALGRIASVTTIPDNSDKDDWARRYAETKRIPLAGRLHDRTTLQIVPVRAASTWSLLATPHLAEDRQG